MQTYGSVLKKIFMNTLTDKNKEIALRFTKDGWGKNPGWDRVWDELMSPNVVYHSNSLAEPIIGLEANKQFNMSLFMGFPDIEQKIEDVIAEDGKVVCRTTIQGTHTGDFLGTPATGQVVKVHDFTLLRIVEGKIVEWWNKCNLLEEIQKIKYPVLPNIFWVNPFVELATHARVKSSVFQGERKGWILY